MLKIALFGTFRAYIAARCQVTLTGRANILSCKEDGVFMDQNDEHERRVEAKLEQASAGPDEPMALTLSGMHMTLMGRKILLTKDGLVLEERRDHG